MQYKRLNMANLQLLCIRCIDLLQHQKMAFFFLLLCLANTEM